jgi:integrase
MTSASIAPVEPVADTNPVVLHHRATKAGLDPSRLSRFNDPVWDLTPGILDEHSKSFRYSFEVFPDAWRDRLKSYVWNLISYESPRTVHASGTPRLALRSITNSRAALNRFFVWVESAGIRDLRDFTVGDYDAFLKAVIVGPGTRDRKGDTLLEVRRLWAYRSLLEPTMQLPPEPPWFGATNRDLLGLEVTQVENRTPRIQDSTIQSLVVWAARFVEDMSDDIIAAYQELGEMSEPIGDRRLLINRRNRSRQERLIDAIEKLRKSELGLPGHVVEGVRELNWSHLNRLTSSRGSVHATYDRDMIASFGLHIDDDAYMTSPCVGKIDQVLWRTRPIAFGQVRILAEHLSTACFVLIAYLSGMRPGEVLNLKRGCVSRDLETSLWLVRGQHFKGVKNSFGELRPEGELRAAPWVVHEIVAKAIEVLERLHTDPLLFPRTLRRNAKAKRSTGIGNAITATQVPAAIDAFVGWVNQYCVQNARFDSIPVDPRGSIAPSRFRRTLAWHIVRQPRGLVAAAIQYGHVWVQMTQGYAGTVDSGFTDELAFEQWLERIEQFADAEEYLDGGGRVSGPAADEFRARTAMVQQKYAGRTMATVRQASRALDDVSVQVFKGRVVHCVFDGSLSLCAREEDAPRLSNCQHNCACIARTDEDIDVLRQDLEEVEAIQAEDGLAPSQRWHRLNSVKVGLRLIIDRHELDTQ